MTVDELNVIIRASTADLQKGLQKAQNEIAALKEKTSSSAGTMGKAFVSLGKAVAAAFSVKALISFGTQAVSLASDLQEVQNVVDTAFGDMAGQINEWSKTTVDQFGMSELSAKRTASTYMAMSKGMGMYGQAAANMAMKAAERTADIASFYNMTQEEADTLLKSIWTGETESLKRIGVVMTQTNLNAYAMAKGIGKTVDQMSQAEQVQLRYQYVMEQTALAQGDFSKTSSSWANQTRVLSERWKEFMSIIGNGLIQVLTPAVQFLNGCLARLIAIAKQVSQVLSDVFGWDTSGAESGAAAIEQMAAAQTGLAEATEKAAKAAKKSQASFDELNVMTAPADSSASAAGSSAVPDLSEIAISKKEMKDTEKGIGRIYAALRDLKKVFDILSPAVNFAKTAFSDFYQFALLPLSQWAIGEAFPRFANITERLSASIDWERLNGSLVGLWNAVVPFTEQVGNGLLWFYENVISPLVEWAAEDLIPTAIDFVRIAIELLNEAIDKAKPVFSWLWENFLVPIGGFAWDVLSACIDKVKDSFQKLSDWASGNNDALDLTSSIILGFFAGIIAYATVKNLMGVIDKIKKSIGTLKEAMEKFGKSSAMAGLKSAFFVAAIAIMAAAIIYLCSNWNKMDGAQRAITILGGLAAAATAAAIAIALFHTSWSVGVAAAAIAGGLAVLGLTFAFTRNSDSEDAISQAEEKATSFYNSYDFNKELSLPALAKGGIAYGATLAMIGEGTHDEAVLPLSSSVYRRIADGISNARNDNGEQNALLREQNSLLRKLLEKETTVNAVVTSSDIIGGLQRKNRRDGKIVVPVGV